MDVGAGDCVHKGSGGRGTRGLRGSGVSTRDDDRSRGSSDLTRPDPSVTPGTSLLNVSTGLVRTQDNHYSNRRTKALDSQK